MFGDRLPRDCWYGASGSKGEFRANLHQGGTAKKIRLTPEERRTAVQATKAMGLGLAGVDFLRTEEGPKVLEVNSSPGLLGWNPARPWTWLGRLLNM